MIQVHFCVVWVYNCSSTTCCKSYHFFTELYALVCFGVIYDVSLIYLHTKLHCLNYYSFVIILVSLHRSSKLSWLLLALCSSIEILELAC